MGSEYDQAVEVLRNLPANLYGDALKVLLDLSRPGTRYVDGQMMYSSAWLNVLPAINPQKERLF